MNVKHILLPVLAALVGIAMLGGCGAHSAQPIVAANTAGPAFTPFHDVVDMDFVEAHIAIPMPDTVMLIDARPYKPKYIAGHIPMAVSIPDTQFEKLTDRLPADKNKLLIFYCGGLKCKLSHKSAARAEALGYTNVKVFAEGYPKWITDKTHYPAVSAEWLKRQIDRKSDMLLVDSRPRRAKYDKGHIPTAVSIPDMQFDDLKDQLPPDKHKLVVFYCGGLKCKLSHKSAARAIALGYTNVKVFADGYPGWVAYAGKSATVTTAAATALQRGPEEGSIDHAAFRRIVTEAPDAIYLVDVRDPDEFKTGSLDTAINIPVDHLEDRIQSLPADRPIVFICGTGARSGESFYMVQDLRPALKQVYYVDGEMTIHKDGTFTLKKVN